MKLMFNPNLCKWLFELQQCTFYQPDAWLWVSQSWQNISWPVLKLLLFKRPQNLQQVIREPYESFETRQVWQQSLGYTDRVLHLMWDFREQTPYSFHHFCHINFKLYLQCDLWHQCKCERTLCTSCRTQTILLTTSGRFLPMGGPDLSPGFPWQRFSKSLLSPAVVREIDFRHYSSKN